MFGKLMSLSFQLLTSWQGMNTKLHWQSTFHLIFVLFNILLFDIFFHMFLFLGLTKNNIFIIY